MIKYAILRNYTVVKIIEVLEDKHISDYIPTNEIVYNINTGNGTIEIPEGYDDITINYIYKDDIWMPPKPNPTYKWNMDRLMWIYDKKLDKPVGNKHVWNNNEWKQVIFNYKEFVELLFTNDPLFLKKKIRELNNILLEDLDDYLRNLNKIDIRSNELKNMITKLSTPEYGNILDINTLNKTFDI